MRWSTPPSIRSPDSRKSKHTPIRVEPFAARWHAFALTRRRIAPPDEGFWVEGRADGHWRQELAGDATPADWDGWARERLSPEGGEWVAYRDASARRFRYASVRDGRLEGCLFVAPDHQLPSRLWLASLFAQDALTPEARLSLLAGRPRDASADAGPIVCSCFGVGRNQIARAIAAGAESVAAIGASVKAGTNCGSCKPELGKLLGMTRAMGLAG